MCERHPNMYVALTTNIKIVMTGIPKPSTECLQPEISTPSKLKTITASVLSMVQKANPLHILPYLSIMIETCQFWLR